MYSAQSGGRKISSSDINIDVVGTPPPLSHGDSWAALPFVCQNVGLLPPITDNTQNVKLKSHFLTRTGKRKRERDQQKKNQRKIVKM
jgi:hypothetical protein